MGLGAWALGFGVGVWVPVSDHSNIRRATGEGHQVLIRRATGEGHQVLIRRAKELELIRRANLGLGFSLGWRELATAAYNNDTFW